MKVMAALQYPHTLITVPPGGILFPVSYNTKNTVKAIYSAAKKSTTQSLKPLLFAPFVYTRHCTSCAKDMHRP